MTAIVMNTENAAVTEHDIDFQSVSGNFAGSATGLFALGGATDNGANIDARIMGPVNDQGSSMKKRPGSVYLSITGPGGSRGQLLVKADGQEYAYPLQVLEGGVSRATPGMGIRANKLGIGYANQDGAAFQLEKEETDLIESKTRRLK